MKKQVVFLESNADHTVKFRNQNLVVLDENGRVVVQHSFHRIFLVFIHGEATITSFVIKNAKKYGVPIVFLSYSLKPYFSVLPGNRGNFLLRKKQYLLNSPLDLARHVVRNKVHNQRQLLASLRYKSSFEKDAIGKMDVLISKINGVVDVDSLLALEGNASKIFFQSYFKNMDFSGRKPRCKTDIVNLLLDIGYHYLFNFIEANLELYGFDTYCGFYHKFFFQRKSLVCDLIEPFRCIIDRRIRKSHSLKQINVSDFGFRNGQFYIKRDFSKKYSRIFLKEILKYKESIFIYIQKFYRAFMKEKKISDYPFFMMEVKK